MRFVGVVSQEAVLIPESRRSRRTGLGPECRYLNYEGSRAGRRAGAPRQALPYARLAMARELERASNSRTNSRHCLSIGQLAMRYERVIVTRYGGPEVISLIEEDLPAPQPEEVRVKVLAAGR